MVLAAHGGGEGRRGGKIGKNTHQIGWEYVAVMTLHT